MTKKYKAKVSYLLLIVIFALFFTPAILGIIYKGIHKEFYVSIGILISSYLFILIMFLNTDYLIENNELKIKCGFLFHKKINIMEIKSIKKTNSLISSPAPSFDRIEITYGTSDTIIISPKDKVTFTKDLTRINHNIKNHISEN